MNRCLPLLLLLCAGCALVRSRHPDAIGNATRATAGRHLELAQGDMERGRYEEAIERLAAVREIEGLVPEDRDRTEALLRSSVETLLSERGGEGHDSGDLVDVYEMDLPPRLKARAGILAAEKRLEEGRRVSAYKLVRRVELDLPSHAERRAAGSVLARAGFSLAADPRRYNLIMRYRSRGIDALEFLVVTYPFDEHCAEAYWVLGRTYEERGNLDLAVARYEDLVIYHPETRWEAMGQARLPYVRMKRLHRDDYDRRELVRASQELDAWLARHAGHELEPWVREQQRICRTRLAVSDLSLARYYERIENPAAVRLHAERAVATAELAPDAGLAEEARALLAAHSEAAAEALPPSGGSR